MKRFLAVLLAVIIAVSAFSVAAFAFGSGEMKVLVMADPHLSVKDSFSATVPHRNADSEDFFHAASGGKLPDESYALLKEFLKEAAQTDAHYLLIPGDLTEGGKREAHEVLIKELTNFQNATGKKVYVVPGNHDFYAGITPKEFAELYKELGYDPAEMDAYDEKTASYTVDLSDGYRLLAVNSCKEGYSEHGMNAYKLNWIEEQCKKAQQDGKKLIAMMHHNVLDHFALADMFHKGATIPESVGLRELLANYGVKYVLTGHSHENDIAAYTAKNGNTIYDILTGALICYPNPYREITFGKDVKVTTKNITSVDTSLVPKGMSAKAQELLNNDFPLYAYNMSKVSIRKTFTGLLTPGTLKNIFGVNANNRPDIANTLDKIGNNIKEVSEMPFYVKDQLQRGKSIEAIAGRYLVTLPKSDYADLMDLMVRLYIAHCKGDENFPSYSTEMVLLTRATSVAITYALKDVSDKEFVDLLTFMAQKLGVSNVSFVKFVGNVAARFDGAEYFVARVLTPTFSGIFSDDGPLDLNVTLPPYEQIKEPNKGAWQGILDFNKKVNDFWRTIFAFMPGAGKWFK